MKQHYGHGKGPSGNPAQWALKLLVGTAAWACALPSGYSEYLRWRQHLALRTSCSSPCCQLRLFLGRVTCLLQIGWVNLFFQKRTVLLTLHFKCRTLATPLSSHLEHQRPAFLSVKYPGKTKWFFSPGPFSGCASSGISHSSSSVGPGTVLGCLKRLLLWEGPVQNISCSSQQHCSARIRTIYPQWCPLDGTSVQFRQRTDYKIFQLDMKGQRK